MNERTTVHARVVFIGIFALLGLVATTAVAVLTESEGVVATLAGLTGMALGGLLGAPRAANAEPPAPPRPLPSTTGAPPDAVTIERIPSTPEWSERRDQPDLVSDLLRGA